MQACISKNKFGETAGHLLGTEGMWDLGAWWEPRKCCAVCLSVPNMAVPLLDVGGELNHFFL